MPLRREDASAANPAPGSCVIVIDSIFDFSSHANVGSAKSPGTPKLCRTPRRWRYSKRNCPMGIRAGNRPASAAAPCPAARLTEAFAGRPLPLAATAWPLPLGCDDDDDDE